MPESKIIPLDSVDPSLVEDLLDQAFEPGRHTRTAYRIREGMDWLPALSFAALDEHDMLAGTIQCWPVALTDPKGRRFPMIMVGPVAVLPQLQGAGYGKALVAASLADYLERHPRFRSSPPAHRGEVAYLTTGDPGSVGARAAVFTGHSLPFRGA